MGELIDADVLQDFVDGKLRKSNFSKRDDYSDVIDFKKLLNDFIDNQVSERSLVCLDRKFFQNNFQQSDRESGN